MSAPSGRLVARDAAVCLLLGLVAFLVYNANLRAIAAADSYAARYLPFSIWRHHSLALDPIASVVAQGRKTPDAPGEVDTAFWMLKGRGDRLISLYPVVVPVVIAPLYAPAIVYLDAKGWEPLRLDRVARLMEKLCASLLAAASVALLYLLLRRRSEPGTAVLLTLAFAFGTTTWVISSQALWMHGLGELLVVATLFVLTGPRTAWRVAAAGLLCALIACNRQPDAVLAAGLGLYALWWAGRSSPLFLAAAAVPVGLLLTYNWLLVGHLVGAYALVGKSWFLDHDPLTGIAGLLVSPTRGLFVFSPFLLLVPLCLPRILRDRSARGLTVAVGGAVVLQLALYGLADWRQGISWGPRWLTDMLPILVWMLPPAFAALSAAGRVAFVAACVVAIAIEAVGAFWYTGAVDTALLAATGPDRMRAAWDVRNAPFIAELRHPRAPADLMVELDGSIDIAAVREEPGGAVGPQLEIAGWALADRRTPAELVVTIDGRFTAGTTAFFERIDVVRALGETSPSGWRVTVPARDLAPGEHVVAALVRADTSSEPRLLRVRNFTVTADDAGPDRELAVAARQAARVLAERQQGPGYWLTTYTDGASYERPGREMNTFTNAVMLDVVGPVAEAAGVAGVAAHARDFLARQIEAGGLVRYHGRADAPTIGSLGCKITPDADDTALVWRVAPPADHPELLREALATLDRFRTGDGLYRTWLAPRERYECIDPGNDANPADIGIQMHVLMLLAQADPPAATALCAALRRGLARPRNWVYYTLAPPVVILRLADLREAGCELELPPWRTETSVPGQETWTAAAQLVQQIASAQSTSAAYPEISRLLRKLAADNFALLAQAPPLIYHNDLTASVRRFYWSEELGYALWLRLYFEDKRARSRLTCLIDRAEHKCGDN